MIELNGLTKLTSPIERDFVAIGGADPLKTFDNKSLGDALVDTIETLAAQQSPLLEKLYQHFAKMDSTLPTLEELKQDSENPANP